MPSPHEGAASPEDSPLTVGALDVGTNSVLLLVARASNGRVEDVLFDGERNPRLGQGLGAERRLQREAMARTADAIGSLVAAAPPIERIEWRAAGTSALRDAVNRDEFLAMTRDRSNIDVTVIGGEREAELTFAGVCTDPSIALLARSSTGVRDPETDGDRRNGGTHHAPSSSRQQEHGVSPRLQGRLLVLADIGGGSTELMWGRESLLDRAISVDVGSSRLLRTLPGVDVYTELVVRELRETALRALEGAALDLPRTPSPQVVLSGGTAKTLLDVEAATGSPAVAETLSRVALEQRLAALARATHAERVALPGLPAERADTIVAGAAIVLAILDLLGLDTARVSRRGLRHGIAIQARWP